MEKKILKLLKEVEKIAEETRKNVKQLFAGKE